MGTVEFLVAVIFGKGNSDKLPNFFIYVNKYEENISRKLITNRIMLHVYCKNIMTTKQ